MDLVTLIAFTVAYAIAVASPGPGVAAGVAPARGGGRHGLHTEELGYLLAEMQHLHRSHPGATW